MTTALVEAHRRRSFRLQGGDIELVRARVEDASSVRELVFSVLDEFGLRVEPEGADRDLFDLAGYYDDRGGVLWLLRIEQRLRGTVALLPRDREEVEFRRLYLDPAVRGSGLGRELLDHTIELARDCGFRSMVLDTASVLERAIGLYVKRGFVEDVRDPVCNACDQRFRLAL